ncbi:DUF3592 domain-containing protein [Saccharopolyspora gloriosae]|uniref:DUF3592 domain-containing protein n=1 Tax=Saccharopolyspora gloriosae TaxID=455344 RepID=UPI001FB5C945|nr:DUF3592 domain-containing protein [Saccharopolyspora gloriosae]
MANDAVSPDATGPVAGGGTDDGGRWPARRIRRACARGVLVLGVLLTVLGLSVIVACGIDDRTIAESRGDGVAEVLDTSLTRTVIRFSTPEGQVHIPQDGVLYPAGLQEGQFVRVEYDTRNPDLVRVADRGMVLSLLPVSAWLAGLWVVVGGAYWLLRRGSPSRDER